MTELNLEELDRIINAALCEDLGSGDITSRLTVPQGTRARLAFKTREPMVVCGLAVIARVFDAIAPGVVVTPVAAEGAPVPAGTVLATAEGDAHTLLSGERVALNLLQRMSAVATLTRRYVEAVAGTNAVILDTRKTMPGLRAVDKYATATGGAKNHRYGLFDAVLIKDNHIAISGSLTEAVHKAKAGAPAGMVIEAECDTLHQVAEALATEADIILLDNFSPDQLRQAVALNAGRKRLEASGNVSLETVAAIAKTGVDFISAGRLTHSVPNVDIGLDFEFQET